MIEVRQGGAHERSAIVVGATGFVGRHLVAALREQGWRVVALIREGSHRSGALHDPCVELREIVSPPDFERILAESGVAHVFHLAAHQSRGDSAADIEKFADANLRLSMHVFGAAASHGARVVSALSYFQYRNGRPSAHSLYSATKLAQAEFAKYWREVRGADIRDVVLFDNYGPHDDRDKLIPALVRAASRDEEIVVGPREQRVDILHVRDVASGLIAVAEDVTSGTLAVRAATLVTVGEIIDTISDLAGRPVRAVIDPARQGGADPGEAGEWHLPAGWTPEIQLRRGLYECMA